MHAMVSTNTFAHVHHLTCMYDRCHRSDDARLNTHERDAVATTSVTPAPSSFDEWYASLDAVADRAAASDPAIARKVRIFYSPLPSMNAFER
jgi:hypothetical protein